MKTVRVFVYGTLMKGMRNHGYEGFAMSAFIRKDSVKGELYTNGSYPVLFDGTDDVPGEVYAVPLDIFMEICEMELRAEYYLEQVETNDYDFVYVFKGKEADYAFVKKPKNKIEKWEEKHV